MAYNEALGDRVRAALSGESDIEERLKMGGLSFMRSGKVCVRVQDDDLLVRCRPEMTDALLAEPGARRYEMKNKPDMRGWILVGREGTNSPDGLDFWIRTALDFGG